MALSVVGRTGKFFGARSRLPLALPEMIRIISRNLQEREKDVLLSVYVLFQEKEKK